MNESEQNELLKQVLTDDSDLLLRRTTFDSGLKALRRRRMQRRLARIGVTVSLSLFVAIGIVVKLSFTKSMPKIVSAPSQVTSSVTPSVPPKIKIITDDELFALFPDRPVMLIGKPGHQQLVFLDAPQLETEKGQF